MAAVKAVFLLIVTCLQLSESRFGLHLLERVYLPYEYTDSDPPVPRFQYNRRAAGRVKFDPTYDFAYVIGDGVITVLDMADVSHLDIVHHHTENGHTFRDIALCGDFVLVTADHNTTPADGKVFIYRKYNRISNSLPSIHAITVGHNPKSIVTTNNCENVLVALEGAAFYVGPTFNNPEGGVGFIHFTGGDIATTPNYKVIDFTHFNAQQDDYISRGVRFVYRTDSTFSQDLEPESITLNVAQTHAYVALQENNAIAEVDISDFNTASVIELYALGFKKWHNLLMDASDFDQGVIMRNWDVFGMYQPDEIVHFDVDGTGYLLCANEGKHKEYGLFYTEAKRGLDFVIEDRVHSSVSLVLRDQLLTDSNLGRLEFSVESGKEADGKHSDFYSFGARSFSIRRADNATVIVYESGDLSERHHHTLTPITFNTDPEQETQTVLQTRDTRSDNRGPEPESVAVGVINGETVIFVGNERTSSVEIYSVRHAVTSPLFHNISTLDGFAKVGFKWTDLYNQRHTGDLGPEGLLFIDARDSPNLEPLLLVSGSVSGTLAVYQISQEDEIDNDQLAAKMNDLFTLGDLDEDERLSRTEHHDMVLAGDVNGNGRLDRVEFYDDFSVKVGLLEDKADFVFNEMDRDNNRHIEEYDTSSLFHFADRDQSNTVTRDEFGREYKRIFVNSIDLGPAE